MLGSDPVIRHVETMDARVGLAELQKDAVAGTQPNVITYIAKSTAWTKCRMPKRASQIFVGMQLQRFKPKVITTR